MLSKISLLTAFFGALMAFPSFSFTQSSQTEIKKISLQVFHWDQNLPSYLQEAEVGDITINNLEKMMALTLQLKSGEEQTLHFPISIIKTDDCAVTTYIGEGLNKMDPRKQIKVIDRTYSTCGTHEIYPLPPEVEVLLSMPYYNDQGILIDTLSQIGGDLEGKVEMDQLF